MIGVESKHKVINIALRMTAISIDLAAFGEKLSLSSLVLILGIPPLFFLIAEYD